MIPPILYYIHVIIIKKKKNTFVRSESILQTTLLMWLKWCKILQYCRKHFGKMRKILLPSFSRIVTERPLSHCRQKGALWGKGLKRSIKSNDKLYLVNKPNYHFLFTIAICVSIISCYICTETKPA